MTTFCSDIGATSSTSKPTCQPPNTSNVATMDDSGLCLRLEEVDMIIDGVSVSGRETTYFNKKTRLLLIMQMLVLVQGLQMG